MLASIPGSARSLWNSSTRFTKISALILSFTARKSRSSGVKKAMSVQETWRISRRIAGKRLVGILKCRLFHVHMINVLKQSEMIPKVPRCLDSGTHKRGGLPGVVVLVAGASIYLWISKGDRSSKVKGVGFSMSSRVSGNLYVRVLFGFHIRCAKVSVFWK